MTPPASVTARAVLTVFLPFAAGYYLSYLFRSVNAVIADRLQVDLGLGAAELGLLSAAYFVAFAAFQLPLGLLLDRFGPRKVHGILLLIASAGATLFALGEGLLALWLGRALIGLGVSGGLMASFKAITQWFPERRWAVINGLFLAMGGLGAITSTLPVEALLQVTDWRGLFVLLAAATFGVSLLIFLVVPERKSFRHAPPLHSQLQGIRAIYTDRFFWRIAPVACLCMSTSLSINSLWVGPWLRDVGGFGRGDLASTLFFMTCAMTAGFIFWGTLAERLERRGISVAVTMGSGTVFFLTALLLLSVQWSPDALWPWIFFGFFSNVTTLGYTLLTRHFPLTHSGRAQTAFNVLVFIGAFATQYAMGGIIALWPPLESGRAPPEAYVAAFGVFTLTCSAAFVWFLAQARHAPTVHRRGVNRSARATDSGPFERYRSGGQGPDD